MPKKNLPALPSAQKKSKKYTPVSYTEEPVDIHAQKKRELEKLKADQSELAGITQQLNQYKSDPLTMLTQRASVSALEQRAADITNRYGSQAALDRQTAALEKQVNDPKLQYLNSSDFRSQYQRLLDLGAGGQSVQNNFAEAGLEYLTPEERGAYNYHYYKHGKDKADAYLATIQGTVNARRAAEIVGDTSYEEIPLLDNALKLYQGYQSGLDTWQQNMRHSSDLLHGNDRYVAPSAQQIASGTIRQQMREKGLPSQIAYDVATGVGQMTPALWTSTLADLVLPGSGKVLGAGMMGRSSAGGAYQDAINRGYSADQARGYGILTGASEAGLGYLLSGISKLGGKVTGPMVEKLSGKVNHALLKVAARYGGEMLSEFGEEYIQSVLSDVLENLTLGTDNDIDLLSEEAIYDGIVGAFNSLVLGVGGNAFSQANGIPDAQTIAEQNLMFKTQTGPGENIDFDRKGRAFDPVRESSFKVMDSIARATGKKFHIYESYVNQDGKHVIRNEVGQEEAAPNGIYKDGEFYIDLNAGESGEGTMLYTVAHELTHFIKEQSPEQFNALAETAMEVHGASKDALIQRQIEKAALQRKELTAEEAFEEVIADSMESMLQSGNVTKLLGNLSRQNMPLHRKVISFLADTTANLRSAVDAYSTLTPNTPEGKAIAQVSDTVSKLEKTYAHALADAGEIFRENTIKRSTAEGIVSSYGQNPKSNFLGNASTNSIGSTKQNVNSKFGFIDPRSDAVKYSIRQGMTEQERFEDLKGKIIVIAEDTESSKYTEEIHSLEALQAKAKGKAEKIIKPLVRKLGILNKDMTTPELEMRFQFSGGGLGESIHKQLRYGGGYVDFAKAMINMDKILENAVLLEVHGDKYTGTIRENENLESVSVLFGAFQDDNSIIPVQMEIKKTSDAGNRLYMTVAMTKIEAGVKGKTIDQSPPSSLLPASMYKLADIFENVNPQDAHFLKYLPDEFLSEEQVSAKKRALFEDNKRIGEMQKVDKPQYSLREQAAEKQYTRWIQETEEAKRVYGDFDLGVELQDPRFRKLLQSGISVPDAYLVTHQGDILIGATRMGLRLGEEKVNRRVEENRRRPRENGLDPGAPFITKPNVAKMTRADRLAIAHRVQKGERIVF